MPTGNVETYYADNKWHNRIEGTADVFGTDATRGSAIWAGRTRARRDKVAHIIRGSEGQVEQRHTYAESDGVMLRAPWRPTPQ